MNYGTKRQPCRK